MLSLNSFKHPIMQGSFNNDGVITSSSSKYPIKYLREFFVPYTTSLEITTLLT